MLHNTFLGKKQFNTENKTGTEKKTLHNQHNERRQLNNNFKSVVKQITSHTDDNNDINNNNNNSSSSRFSLEDIKNAFRKNTTQSECVPYISISISCDEDNTVVEDEGWVRFPLGPGGPMGLILRYTNHLFRSGSHALQNVILREEINELQNEIPNRLKGRKWPSRRVSEAIGSCLNGGKVANPLGTTSEIAQSQNPWNELCYAALCEIQDIQILIVNTEKKTVTFAPEDIRLWKKNTSTFAMTHDGKLSLEYSGSEDGSFPYKKLGPWISKMEANSWTFSWPLAEGTMEELRNILEESNVPVQGRMKKEDMAKKAGRSGAIKMLFEWETAN